MLLLNVDLRFEGISIVNDNMFTGQRPRLSRCDLLVESAA